MPGSVVCCDHRSGSNVSRRWLTPQSKRSSRCCTRYASVRAGTAITGLCRDIWIERIHLPVAPFGIEHVCARACVRVCVCVCASSCRLMS